MANRCRITVLKITNNKELAMEYGHKGEPCPVFQEGQVFHTKGIFGNDIPGGFCHMAWQALFMPVNVLAGGGRVLGQDDVHIACCTDGLRPVVFKIEREGNEE
jgi:TIGR04076 family protein